MKRKYLAATISLLLGSALVITPVWAAKPEMAGQGMSKEQRSTMKEEQKLERTEASGMMDQDNGDKMRTRDEMQEQDRDRDREHMGSQQNMDNKGMEKQREMKSEEEMKESGKGSEQGQESREKRKKWWRFWE